MFSSHMQWNPDQYGANARFVSELGMPVVELLSPRAGESILDLGCGDGVLTAKLVQRGCKVFAVDSSPEMIAAAQSLGLNAHVMDGHALQFADEFDAVFSNAALHWMKNPAQVIDGAWRALKFGGRFVGEFGGYGNVATIVAAIESALATRGIIGADPWFFPHSEEYRALLQARGFMVISIALLPRPTPLSGDVGRWLELFARPYISLLPSIERKGFVSELVEALRPALCDAGGHWTVDYVRLRFFARKPLP